VRSTQDIDILMAPADVDRALDAVRPIGYKLAALPLAFDEGTVRERHVQRVSKIAGGEHLVVGFLLERAALAGLLADPVEIVLAEGPLWVVSREVLLRMKRMTGRAQDLADLERLERGDGRAPARAGRRSPAGGRRATRSLAWPLRRRDHGARAAAA
jgi:hypothetical protein